jgi:hypothetical protein
MRMLLITHEDLARSPAKSQSRFVAALEERSDVTTVFWERLVAVTPTQAAAAAGAALSDYDACLLFVRFRHLSAAPALEWLGYSGLRVWLDEDAWWNYTPARGTWRGAFPPTFHRHRFDLLIATGRRTAELLERDGVRAAWIPKGYAADAFHDLELARKGVCTFGNLWPSRARLITYLRQRGVPVTDVSGPFLTLNERMNRHVAGVVCNMPGRYRLGRGGRVQRYLPGMVETWPAIEPMIKTFETAATGCALVVDHLDELADLGFVHGQTCLVYHDFAEALALLRATEPEELARIGRAGAELTRERHTWQDRAAETIALLEGMT